MVSSTDRNFGKLIKSIREDRQLTQDELAQKINKKRSYISRVENGHGNINLKTFQEIIENGLGCEIIIKH